MIYNNGGKHSWLTLELTEQTEYLAMSETWNQDLPFLVKSSL
jgi:hypothetical protein